MVRRIKAKLVLQLRSQGLSGRAIAAGQGMSRHSVQASRPKNAKPQLPLQVSRKTAPVVSVSHVLRFAAKKAPNSVSRVPPLRKHRAKSVILLYQI